MRGFWFHYFSLAVLLCVSLIVYIQIILREGKAEEGYITLGIEASEFCDGHLSRGC